MNKREMIELRELLERIDRLINEYMRASVPEHLAFLETEITRETGSPWSVYPQQSPQQSAAQGPGSVCALATASPSLSRPCFALSCPFFRRSIEPSFLSH